jgi:hypothetical protein
VSIKPREDPTPLRGAQVMPVALERLALWHSADSRIRLYPFRETMTPAWLQYGMFAVTAMIALITMGAAAVSYFLFRSHVDPHVVVYTKHDEDRPSLLLVVIENIGAGVAHDVHFRLSRPIPRRAFGIEKPERKNFDPMSDGPLATGVPLLAPGEKRIITWGQFGGLIHKLGSEPVRVVATYQSRSSLPWDPTDHVAESLLEVFSFETTDASESPDVRQVRELEKIAHALEGSGRSVREIASAMTKPEMEAAIRRIHERKAAILSAPDDHTSKGLSEELDQSST